MLEGVLFDFFCRLWADFIVAEADGYLLLGVWGKSKSKINYLIF